MRQIDADDLKEAFDTAFFNDEDDYKRALRIIDNAPTVIPDNDIFEWCTDCKEYDQEKHCCHRWSSKIREAVEEVKQYKLDELRPKGEWIKEPNGKTTDIYRCSICGRSILLCKNADLSKYPFCHCGADMRKGGAE